MLHITPQQTSLILDIETLMMTEDRPDGRLVVTVLLQPPDAAALVAWIDEHRKDVPPPPADGDGA